MFGIGLPEMAVIAIVATIFIGPERLPSLARRAAHLVRAIRSFADDAVGTLREELGDDFKDIELRDLDPRVAIRKHVLDVVDDGPSDRPAA